MAFGAALLPVRAAFVCRYIGARRMTRASVVEALRRALSDRSGAVRRFAADWLNQLGLDTNEGEGHQASNAEG